jgi:hypothetical protein
MKLFVLPINYLLEPVERINKDHFVCVFLSAVTSEEIRNFRCLECGWVVFQYSNKEVDAIVYGNFKPQDKNSVDVMCSRCKLVYRVV